MGRKGKAERAGAKAANDAVNTGRIAEHEVDAFREGFERGYAAARLDTPDTSPVRKPVYLPPDGKEQWR